MPSPSLSLQSRVSDSRIVGELWTSAQRQASRIHEISYRACFKPQVPRYFIERFSGTGDIVYDPFMGRGTTILEAVLLGRRAIGNDINPLSRVLVEPRLSIPSLDEVAARLTSLSFSAPPECDIDLSMFYHRRTLDELLCLRSYLKRRRETGREDATDRWIRMVATNRLTGHSPGFFSVYTLPPNQATSPQHQKRINRERRQRPSYRNVKELILRKTRRILSSLEGDERRLLSDAADRVMLLCTDARETRPIGDNSVQLTVTSPPFLNIVNYASDNWLRCWFNAVDLESVSAAITTPGSLAEWEGVMARVFRELYRITKPRGFVAFEVGEIRKRTVELDRHVIPLGTEAGFRFKAVYVNQQRFTKTSNIWGIRNNEGGTNTNRIVLFEKQ